MSTHGVLLIQTIVPHYALPLFQRLAASQEMDLTVACGQAREGDSLDNVPSFTGVSREPLRNLYLHRASTLRFQKGLFPLLRSGRFDTVIAEFDLHVTSNVLACALARRLGVRFIWWGHGLGVRRRRLSIVLRLWLCTVCDAIILYDSVNAHRLTSLGVDREKIFVAWNSIDTDEIKPLAQVWNSDDRYRILYIGRLTPEKNVDLLVKGFGQALPELCRLRRRCQLTIIGDGPERAALERLVSHLGISHAVEFTGALYIQEQLAPYFNAAMVSVSPGRVGLSAIQSLAFGVPMLVADRESHGPEICAVKPNENALMFSARDTHDLACRLTQMARGPDALAEMSANAVRTIEAQFSLPIMVTAFEDAVQYAHKDG